MFSLSIFLLFFVVSLLLLDCTNRRFQYNLLELFPTRYDVVLRVLTGTISNQYSVGQIISVNLPGYLSVLLQRANTPQATVDARRGGPHGRDTPSGNVTASQLHMRHIPPSPGIVENRA